MKKLLGLLGAVSLGTSAVSFNVAFVPSLINENREEDVTEGIDWNEFLDLRMHEIKKEDDFDLAKFSGYIVYIAWGVGKKEQREWKLVRYEIPPNLENPNINENYFKGFSLSKSDYRFEPALVALRSDWGKGPLKLGIARNVRVDVPGGGSPYVSPRTITQFQFIRWENIKNDDDDDVAIGRVFIIQGSKDKLAHPSINETTGNFNDLGVNLGQFSEGVRFSLADSKNLATWVTGQHLTVDGEVNVSIRNSNVESVVFDEQIQTKLNNQINIKIKPESEKRDHKLVIHYTIDGQKYDSKPITITMTAKIDPPTPVAKKDLKEVVKNTNIGNVGDNEDGTLFQATQNSNSVQIDFSQIEIKNRTQTSAVLKAKNDSDNYQGEVTISFNIVEPTVNDLQLDFSTISSKTNLTKEYVGQINSSKLDNPTSRWFFADGEVSLKSIKPTPASVITGVITGLDSDWQKTTETLAINSDSPTKIDGSQLSAFNGRYLIELTDELGATSSIYLQVEKKQEVSDFWITDNGKKFLAWAKENGFGNSIMAYTPTKLNNLMKQSQNWKDSLKHLNLEFGTFEVAKISDVTSEEVKAIKEKVLKATKSEIQQFKADAVESKDYVIDIDKVKEGDWSERTPTILVQAVEGSKILNGFATTNLKVKEIQNPAPEADTISSQESSPWVVVGAFVGTLAMMGLGITGLYFYKKRPKTKQLEKWASKIEEEMKEED